jgi:hypothetical protein
MVSIPLQWLLALLKSLAAVVAGNGNAAILQWARDGTTFTPWIPNAAAVQLAAQTWGVLYANDFLAHMPNNAQVPNFMTMQPEVRQRLLGTFGAYLDSLPAATKTDLEPLLPVLAAFMNNGGPCCTTAAA